MHETTRVSIRVKPFGALLVQKSRSRSCFLVLSFVLKIVLFGALPRAKNCARDHAFCCSPLCKNRALRAKKCGLDRARCYIFRLDSSYSYNYTLL